jgi:hypothetical protein
LVLLSFIVGFDEVTFAKILFVVNMEFGDGLSCSKCNLNIFWTT